MTSSSLTSRDPWSIYSFAPIDSRCYVLVEEAEALIIDPMANEQMLQALRAAAVGRITVILTHEHYDHCGGVNWLRAHWPTHVIASEACAENLGRPTINGSRYFEALYALHDETMRARVRALDVKPYSTTADATFSVRLELAWHDHRVVLTEAPGHTSGSILIDVDDRWLFTGDSWIPGRPTITRLPSGSTRLFQEVTKPQLDALLRLRTIMPGHHDPVAKGRG